MIVRWMVVSMVLDGADIAVGIRLMTKTFIRIVSVTVTLYTIAIAMSVGNAPMIGMEKNFCCHLLDLKHSPIFSSY